MIWSLLTGRLVREKVDPAVLNAVESQVRAHDTVRHHNYRNSQFTMALRRPFLQMSAAEVPDLHGDHADIFGTSGTNGMARVAIDALPVVTFTERSNVDASGELIACSVCLQVTILPAHRILPSVGAFQISRHDCRLCIQSTCVPFEF